MTRDQRLIVVFMAVAAVAAAVAAGTVVIGRPQPVAALTREVPVGPDATLTLRFAGDTMLGDQVQNQIDRRRSGYDWPFDAVRSATTAADFVIVNAEGPIGDQTRPWNPGKPYSYSSRPPVAAAMARAGVDAVTLANNHSFDTGPQGLTDTIENLRAAGLTSVGAGPDLARAEQPLLLRTEIGTIGIVAMGESYGFRATANTAGTVVISPETVARGATLARAAGADWVIAFVHWGDNYVPVNAKQRAAAQLFADAGYDMVVGANPHVAQPIEFIGSMPVVFSVGNFVFGAPGRFDQFKVPGFGLTVDLELSRDRAPQLSIHCLVTDNMIVAYQPRPCDAAQANAILPTLHPQMQIRGDTGVLPCAGCFRRKTGRP